MLTQWVVMVLHCNVLCHLQQCKCPDQDLLAPLYTNCSYWKVSTKSQVALNMGIWSSVWPMALACACLVNVAEQRSSVKWLVAL